MSSKDVNGIHMYCLSQKQNASEDSECSLSLSHVEHRFTLPYGAHEATTIRVDQGHVETEGILKTRDALGLHLSFKVKLAKLGKVYDHRSNTPLYCDVQKGRVNYASC